MDNFQLEKHNALTKTDKSHEQKIDDRILDLCNKINNTNNYFTTSSCSGRITIIPSTDKKLHNAFLFKSHDKITLQQLQSIIRFLPTYFLLPNTYYLRVEPTALHIAAKTLTDAQDLLNKARNCGWKKSGIISSNSRYIIELFSTEFIATPLTKDLPETYLQLLVDEANKKLERTWTKIEKLKGIFK